MPTNYIEKTAHPKSVIVFSGYNQRAVIAFIRTLEQLDCDYGIIAASDDDPILRTAYKDRVYAIRKLRVLDKADLVDSISKATKKLKNQHYIIAPSTESLNRFFLENPELLNYEYAEIPLVSKALYERVSDKYSFVKLCLKHGIQPPAEYKETDEKKIPFVAKPREYFSPTGETHSPLIIQSKTDYDSFKETYSESDFFCQQFIGGESLYLLYYRYANGKLVKFSQKNLVQQARGKSIVAAQGSNFHESSEAVRYEQLLESIDFTGLIMIEVKKYNDQYFMIEANPRFWGPSQLFVDAGINLFHDFLFEWGVTNIAPVHEHNSGNMKYFWSSGVRESIKKYGYVDFHDYSDEKLHTYYSDWMAYDVYHRDDTIGIYEKEA